MREKFPQTCKQFNPAQGKFPRGNITRDSRGGGNIHIENSRSCPLNFRWKVMRKFPQG